MGGCAYAPHRPGMADLPRWVAKTQEDAMRCTENEIGIMDEYEALKIDQITIEEAMHWRGLSLAERNALDFQMQELVEEMAGARAGLFA